MEENIFWFNDSHALQLQSDDLCTKLYDHFWSTVLGCDKAFLLPTPKLERMKQSYHTMDWLARYASVVLFPKLDSLNCTIVVLGLDHWESVVHASVHDRESTSIPDVRNSSTFELGVVVPSSEISELLRKFHSALIQSEQDNTGNQRGQRPGHQGNQKTPTFARTILLQVLNDSPVPLPIQGGTTDVGLHTGCLLRNTSYPLVLSAVYTMLDSSGLGEAEELFNKCVALYYLSFLQDMVPRNDIYDARCIDRSILVLRELQPYLLNVNDSVFENSVLEEMEKFRKHLDGLRFVAKAPMLPKESVEEARTKLRAPNFPMVPDTAEIVDDKTKLERVRDDAKKNIMWSDVALDCKGRSSYTFTGRLQDAHVHIVQLNAFFWEIATHLDDHDIRYDVSDLYQRLIHFSKVTKVAYEASKTAPKVMTVVLSSCELLATWITYCWAHRVAEEEHALFQSYGPSLNPADLKHVVLNDVRAVEAVKCVRRFLRHRKQRNSRTPFRNYQDTLILALELGRSLSDWRDIYEDELEAANKKIDERWVQITQTQKTLSKLDGKLRAAEIKLKAAERNTKISENRDYHWIGRSKVYDQTYYEIVQVENECRAEVGALKQQIQSLEAKPPNLLFGLPRNRDKALQWMFFLFMPKEFQDLTMLGQLGESMLWKAAPSAQCPTTNLESWFVNHALTTSTTVKSRIILGSPNGPPSISTPNIRQYSRETGVFFPDNFSLVPTWHGSDPFQPRDDKETTLLFTEMLPSELHNSKYMQSYLAMLPTPVRENEAIARREQKPDYLTAEQYIVFANLRSYPRTQVRCLVEALVENQLPFDHISVHILLKQMIYHVGEEDWKKDLSPGWQGLSSIASELERHLELLKNSPRQSHKLVLFGEMSSFFGQYNEDCRLCALRFARVAREWAEEVGEEIKAQGKNSFPAHLYAKQAKLYGYAIVCHSMGNIENKDFLQVAELVILFKNRCLFASCAKESDSLYQQVLSVMAARIDGLIQTIRDNPKHLTKCIALILDDIPCQLAWCPVVYDDVAVTGCYEAVSECHMYSVNLLNGEVLVDGVPPGLLPNSVTDHPLYQRTFGKRTFEMIVLGFRHYRAAKRVNDHFLYEFMVGSMNELHILEHDSRNSEFSSNRKNKLLLLPRDSMDLPEIVREKHSHWYSEAHKAVFVRHPSYQVRKAEYALRDEACYCIPFKFQDLPLNSVVSKFNECEQMLLGETSLLSILNRFENDKYIHISVDPSLTRLRYYFPRFELSFEHRNSGILSGDFQGYFMDEKQGFDDTLPGLTSCILLRRDDGSSKVLLPEGTIGQTAQVSIPEGWDAECDFHSYDVHRRFQTLTAVDMVGRLHLAGLYASNACELTDSRIGKRGSEIATDLVRCCWKNEPLSNTERSKLIEVSRQSALSCTLKIMCGFLWRSANSLSCLADDEVSQCPELDTDPLAIDEYRRNKFAPRLLAPEELSFLGSRQSEPTYIRSPVEKHETENMAFVRQIEAFLQREFSVESQSETRNFPLSIPEDRRGLAVQVFDDLEKSYKIFQQQPYTEVTNFEQCRIRSLAFSEQIEGRRKSLESDLIDELAGCRSLEQRLLQVSGTRRMPSLLDLVRVSFDFFFIRSFDPYKDTESGSKFWIRVVDWLVLCVMEDKLHRISSSACHRDGKSLQIELECIREWSPHEYPRWLAFEVEQQLQIRPFQFAIVNQLLQNPGSMIQLDMGLGKTRVLVPMLILYFLSKPEVPRINLLPTIFHEAAEYYRNVLVASVQHVKLFCLPFQRDFPLESFHAQVLSNELEKSRLHNGCFVITPQHRNSLVLKQQEKKVKVDALGSGFLDIIDESDAILDYNFQLVYALGTQLALPDGPCRWTVVESLLKVLGRNECREIYHIMSDKTKVHSEKSECGCFPKMRLLLPFRGSEDEVGVALCRYIVANPPHELRWMKKVSSESVDVLVRIMSDQALADVECYLRSNSVFEAFRGHILAVRGCIAHGLLFHALAMRYRVNYGLLLNNSKKMAVPYSASDTPKYRTEFSQPDMAILYTALSYLNEGLTKTQFREAVSLLQRSGPSVQVAIYREWVDAVRMDVELQDLCKFDDIHKVDLTNNIQLDIMHKKMGRCMEVVYFWMNNFVFETDTFQFPEKLATSAWNLVETGSEIGFSGTDDNRFSLPLQVRQIPSSSLQLRATNGEILNRIIESTKDILLLDDNAFGQVEMWQVVLQNCLSCGAQALVDVSGLMAGPGNEKVARYLVDSVVGKPAAFRGVVYFCVGSNIWRVLEIDSSQDLPLRRSSVSESECFVYFDESRCRGADMRLKKNAFALVTLQPKLTKDKFLQGCARMRRLGPDGQRLILVGTREVLSPETTVVDILDTIMQNTVRAACASVLTFYERGMEYDSFPDPIKEDATLESLYASGTSKHADLQQLLSLTREEQVLTDFAFELVDYCREIGEGTVITSRGISQECERELEREVEQEEEEELELLKKNPSAQEAWSFEQAFENPESLFGGIFFPVSDFIREKLQQIAAIKWNENMFCTPNFWKTVHGAELSADMSLYLRLVNPVLVMPDGRVVLISLYELDQLLPYWHATGVAQCTGLTQNRLFKWGSPKVGQPNAILKHICLSTTSRSGFGGESINISDDVLTSIKLFRGDVHYSDQEIEVLRHMLHQVPQCRDTIQNLLFIRNRLHLFARSRLESLIYDITFEDTLLDQK